MRRPDVRFNADLYGKLENLANRGYTEGFYQRHPNQDYQNYLQGKSIMQRQQFVGEITGFDSQRGLAEIDVKNKFLVGDRLELILPDGNRDIMVEHMESLKGEVMQEAPGGGYHVRINIPVSHCEKGLLARYLS